MTNPFSLTLEQIGNLSPIQAELILVEHAKAKKERQKLRDRQIRQYKGKKLMVVLDIGRIE